MAVLSLVSCAGYQAEPFVEVNATQGRELGVAWHPDRLTYDREVDYGVAVGFRMRAPTRIHHSDLAALTGALRERQAVAVQPAPEPLTEPTGPTEPTEPTPIAKPVDPPPERGLDERVDAAASWWASLSDDARRSFVILAAVVLLALISLGVIYRSEIAGLVSRLTGSERRRRRR